jgi:hypothetical protein
MKNSIFAFFLLFLHIVLIVCLIVVDEEPWQIAIFISLAATFIFTSYLGYDKNIGAAFGSLLFGGATFWSAAEAINSIDFDKPFFLSFYWSTVGYVLLTLVLLIITIYALSETSNKSDRL